MNRIRLNWPLLHGLLFYFVWYGVVLSAMEKTTELYGIALQVLFVALCLALAKKHLRYEALFILLLTLIGAGIDAVPVMLGIITFPHTQYYLFGYPLWMIGMWSCFATAFSTSMTWLAKKPLAQIFSGVIGGPISLYAAVKLGAVALTGEFYSSLLFVGAEWGVVMFASYKLHELMFSKK